MIKVRIVVTLRAGHLGARKGLYFDLGGDSLGIIICNISLSYIPKVTRNFMSIVTH